MKKVYRIFALILVLLMLSGCNSNNQVVGGNNSPTEELMTVTAFLF